MITATEGGAEIRGVVIAAAVGDLSDGIIVAFHQFHGHLHAVFGEEIEDGLAVKGFETGLQFKLIDTRGLCQARDRVVIAEVLEDGFAHKSQSLYIGF